MRITTTIIQSISGFIDLYPMVRDFVFWAQLFVFSMFQLLIFAVLVDNNVVDWEQEFVAWLQMVFNIFLLVIIAGLLLFFAYYVTQSYQGDVA